MALQLTMTYPNSFPDALGHTREQFEQEAKGAIAVKLFEMGRRSSGMAAVLLGVERKTVLFKLAGYGVPLIDLAPAKLRSDLDSITNWVKSLLWMRFCLYGVEHL